MTKDNVVPAMTNKKFTGVVEDAVKAILAANGGGAQEASTKDTGIRLWETKTVSGGLCDIYLRRSGNLVTIWMRTTGENRNDVGSKPTFTGSSVTIRSSAIPNGFKPEVNSIKGNSPNKMARLAHDNVMSPSTVVCSNVGNGSPSQIGYMGYSGWVDNTVTMFLGRNLDRLHMGELSWVTDDPWPDTLPGTAHTVS